MTDLGQAALDPSSLPQPEPPPPPQPGTLAAAALDPAGELLPRYLSTAARSGEAWDKTAEGVRSFGVEPDSVRKHFDLEQTRQKYEGGTENAFQRVAQVIPGVGTGVNLGNEIMYGRAKRRFDEGKADAGDLDRIAQYEQVEKIKRTEGLGASVLRGVARVPAILGEALVGGQIFRGAGAATAGGVRGGLQLTGQVAKGAATVPALYAEQAVKNNNDAGRNPLDPRGLPAAFGLAMVQTAVLGALGGVGNAAPGGFLGRTAVRTATAVGGQQAADVLTSAADDAAKEVLGKSVGLNTRYGTLGALLRGDDKAVRDAVVQVVTFAAFSAAHGKKDVIKDAAAAADQKAEAGLPPAAAFAEVADAGIRWQKFVDANPAADREQARAAFKDAAESDRPFLDKLIETLPEKAPPAEKPAEPPPAPPEPPAAAADPFQGMSDQDVKAMAVTLGFNVQGKRSTIVSKIKGDPRGQALIKLMAQQQAPEAPPAAPEPPRAAPEGPAGVEPAAPGESPPDAKPQPGESVAPAGERRETAEDYKNLFNAKGIGESMIAANERNLIEKGDVLPAERQSVIGRNWATARDKFGASRQTIDKFVAALRTAYAGGTFDQAAVAKALNEAFAPAKPSEPPPVDRRRDAARRKRVADMTPEERARELLRSPTVDLPNRRAFDEGKSPAVGMSDADGLKAFNDRFGYEAGNELLRAKAEALKAAGLDAFHDKGDEFLYRGADPEEIRAKLEHARSMLRDAVIEVPTKDGPQFFKGADFSYGVGHELGSAEAGLKQHKVEREARGERARGELRGIARVGQVAGHGADQGPPAGGRPEPQAVRRLGASVLRGSEAAPVHGPAAAGEGGAGRGAPGDGGEAGGHVLTGKGTTVLVPGGKPIPARYEVRELGSVVASHKAVPPGAVVDRVRLGEYPEGLQPRDYSKTEAERKKVWEGAARLEPRYLLTDHPDATNGPPTITAAGSVVLNGNGRQMMLEGSRHVGNRYAAYKADLVKRAADYGIDPAAVEGMREPALYRVVGLDPAGPEARAFARAGNVTTTMGQSPERTAAAHADLIDDRLIRSLNLSGDETFSKAVSDPAAGRRFRQLLHEALPPTLRPQYFEEGRDHKLTDAGKEFVQAMLLSRIVPVGVLEKLGAERKDVRRAVEGVIPQLFKLRADHPEFDVTPQLQEALAFLARNPEARDNGRVQLLLDQKDMFSGGAAESISPGGRMILDFLIEKADAPRKFREGIAAVVSGVKAEDVSKTLFGGQAFVQKFDPVENAARLLGVKPRTGAAFGFVKDFAEARSDAAQDVQDGLVPAAAVEAGIDQVVRDARGGVEPERGPEAPPAGGPPLLGSEALRRGPAGPADAAGVGDPGGAAERPGEPGGGDGAGPNGAGSGGVDARAAAERMLAAKIAERTRPPGVSAVKAPPAPPTPAEASFARESAARWVDSFRDFFRKLGGEKFGATRRLSGAAADAGADVDRSRLYGEARAELANDRIFAGDDRPLTRMIAGAVYTEMQLRNTRRAHLLAGDVEAARRVGTVIGSKDPDTFLSAPLQTEADFRHWSNDPAIKAVLARADALVSPATEALFREATGMEPGEPILSKTMIDRPGIPKLSLVSLREGEPTAAEKVMGAEADEIPSEAGRSNLRRHKLNKLGASYLRTGAATHGYELDLGEIVRRNLVDRQTNADKAKFYRTYEAEGIGAWAKPGERPHEGWRRLEDVRPPRGTQAAKAGEIDFWVHPDSYADARQLLEPKEQKWKLPFAAAATWASLRSTVDFVSHSKNLLTQWVSGARLRDMFDAIKKQVLDDPSIKTEIVEIGRLSALSEKHLDVGGGVGAIDPARYAGRVLGLMDRAVRVASLRAYDRMAERGLAEDTDHGRRTFINQIGNYSKLTQNKAVAFVRDIGLGPFATAGSTFWVKGARTLALRPGVRATSWKAQVQLQAEMLARVAVLPALAQIVNAIFHGRPDGDDNTPWGAVKLWDKDGKTSYIDLAGLSGLSRGAREVGLKAVVEGMRPAAKKQGATAGSIADKAVRDAGHAALHPITGPAVDAAHVLMTGENVMGHRVAHRLNAAEKHAGESQVQYNALAAIFESNSLARDWLKPAVEDALGIKKTPAERKHEPTTGERLGGLLGPFGPVQSAKPPGAPAKR